jgi:predicted nucleotidyltransferase
MLQKILRGLQNVEQTRNVTIIYACEAGSRAWGFESSDSDYDIRFVYVKPRDNYITAIGETKDTIEFTIPTQEALDFAGWDILKTMKLAYKSNPSLIEWLYSPIVYKKHPVFDLVLKGYIVDGYSARALMYHYGGLAIRTWYDYLTEEKNSPIKKYFYSLRPAMCIQYMKENSYSIPPVPFETLKKNVNLPTDLLTEVNKLVAYKKGVREMKTNELYVPLIREYIQETMQNYKDDAANAPDGDMKIEKLNSLGIAFINGLSKK